jgi:hypothetical protein
MNNVEYHGGCTLWQGLGTELYMEHPALKDSYVNKNQSDNHISQQYELNNMNMNRPFTHCSVSRWPKLMAGLAMDV